MISNGMGENLYMVMELSYVLTDRKLIAHHGWSHSSIHANAIVHPSTGKSHRVCRHVRHRILHVAVLCFRRRWAFIFHRTEFILFRFKIVIRVGDFTIWSSFVRTTMSRGIKLVKLK